MKNANGAAVRRNAVTPFVSDFNISNKSEMKLRKACVSHKIVVPLHRQSEAKSWALSTANSAT